MSQKHCFSCGQFTDSKHRCANNLGAKGKVPTVSASSSLLSKEGNVSESTVLFASKTTLVTLLPDGSLVKSKTDKQGNESTVEAGFWVKLVYAGKSAKAKKNYALTITSASGAKDKVNSAWENYLKTEEAYVSKNTLINDIASKVARCKDLIKNTDAAADELLASAKTRIQTIVDKASHEVKVALEVVQEMSLSGNANAFSMVEANLELEKAQAVEKVAIEKYNILLDDASLKTYSLKEKPRQALKYLEEELEKASNPDSEVAS